MRLKSSFWNSSFWNIVTCIGRPKFLFSFRPLQIIITMLFWLIVPWIFYTTQETPSTFWFWWSIITKVIPKWWRWWWWSTTINSWKIFCIKINASPSAIFWYILHLLVSRILFLEVSSSIFLSLFFREHTVVLDYIS